MTGHNALRMKPHMTKFCDWAYEYLDDGVPRTAKELLAALHAIDYKRTKYITNNLVVSYALKGDKRFKRIKQSKRDLWTLA